MGSGAVSAEYQEGAGALSHQGIQQVTLRASTDGCQQSVLAVPGSSGSHERRKQAPGLAGMMGTAEARTAGPAAYLSYWEPFNYQASPSISVALLFRLVSSIYLPESHLSDGRML